MVSVDLIASRIATCRKLAPLGGSIKDAAEKLGMSRSTLRSNLQRHDHALYLRLCRNGRRARVRKPAPRKVA
ncbi:hypothetical protein KUV46_15785 [Thalassovita mediterranea]|nr:hypothetical protein KUV46_15785 [Thalassovita mediterranea]